MEQVDDLYFSALTGSGEIFPISDEKYADELQLQEVLLSSAIAAFNCYGLPTKNISPTIMQARRAVKLEPGQSSSIKTESFCKICMYAAPPSAMFFNANCSHAFCRDCLSQYISTKIKENISVVKCPEEDCKGKLEPEHCQDLIPKQVFDRWGDALCEAMVLSSKNFSYCLFKDCSALLLADEGEGNVAQSECPSCRRMFCAQCEVVWHLGVSCDEFQRLGLDERGIQDLKLIEIARSKKWKRCPQCKFYVEKTQGCLHVTCRFAFYRTDIS